MSITFVLLLLLAAVCQCSMACNCDDEMCIDPRCPRGPRGFAGADGEPGPPGPPGIAPPFSTELIESAPATIDIAVNYSAVRIYSDSSTYPVLTLPQGEEGQVKWVALDNAAVGTIDVQAHVGSFVLTPDLPAWPKTNKLVFVNGTWRTSNWLVERQSGSKLVGTGGTGASQNQGHVSLSEDGNVLAVGGPFATTNQGAVWIWYRDFDTLAWTQAAYLVGTGNTGNARQGISTALSAEGGTVAWGGNTDNANQGRVWVWTVSAGGTWSQQQTMVGTGNTGAAQQGTSIALSSTGDTIAWGGPLNDATATNLGATWVWIRQFGVYTQEAILIGTGGIGTNVQQGVSIALSSTGDTLAVGGPGDDSNIGAIWIFTRTSGVWSQQTKIVPQGSSAGLVATLGSIVQLSSMGDILGSSGVGANTSSNGAYIFVRSAAGTWTMIPERLQASPPFSAAVLFGASFAMSRNGNTLAIGMQLAGLGSVSIWQRTSVGYQPWPVVLEPNDNVGSSFGLDGMAFSAAGNTLAIGGTTDNGGMGATWVYI